MSRLHVNHDYGKFYLWSLPYLRYTLPHDFTTYNGKSYRQFNGTAYHTYGTGYHMILPLIMVNPTDSLMVQLTIIKW
jgi:hypothetical protein